MNLVRLIAMLLVVGCSTAHAQERWNEIPVTDSSIREAIAAPLVGCRPLGRAKVEHHITGDGLYALYGDIFGNGGNFAFTEFDKGAGFCEWKENHWEGRQAWNMPVTWKRDGTKGNSLEERTSGKPVDRAFWTLGVGGRHSVVVIAGEQERSWQVFYVVEFDPKQNAAVVVDQSMREWPYYRTGYVIMSQDSGRKSYWDESLYYAVHDGQLVHVADWYENAENPEAVYEIAQRYRNEDKSVEAFLLKTVEDKDAYSYDISRIMHEIGITSAPDKSDFADAKPYAKLNITWPKGNEPDPNSAEMEIAFLFAKLTRLPVALYPRYDSDHFTQKLERVATVTVSGDAGAVEHLSSNPHKPVK